MIYTQHLPDALVLRGIISVRLLPEGISQKEFLSWWPKISPKDRERYTVYEIHNLITTAGKTNILNYVGATVLATGSSNVGAVIPFSVYFAVGTGIINQPTPGDAVVQGEYYRAQPSLSIVTGNSVTISTLFSTSVGNTTYTNCGIFGGSATGTSGSGTLLTHALYAYTKTSSQVITNDYTINLV